MHLFSPRYLNDWYGSHWAVPQCLTLLPFFFNVNLIASGSVLDAMSRSDLARLLQDDFLVLVALLSLGSGHHP